MEMLGELAADRGFLAFARFAVIAFFAVAFLQSSLDKLLDPDGNLGYLRDHFKSSPLAAETVVPLFWILTVLELAAGVFCGIGLITFSFLSGGFFARWGLRFAVLALLSLMLGQRLAKDYAGAAVVAAYFSVAMLGLIVFAIGR